MNLKKMTCRGLVVSMLALSFQTAGAGMIGGKRAVEHRQIDVLTQPYQVRAVLRIPGVGEGLAPVCDPVSHTVQAGTMGDGAGRHGRVPYVKRPVHDVCECKAEGRIREPG